MLKVWEHIVGLHIPTYACRAVLGETDGAKSKVQGFYENKGIVIVCANCLIRMVNESATATFGYQQPAELVGKNINCIVPPPFSNNHVSVCVRVRVCCETWHACMARAGMLSQHGHNLHGCSEYSCLQS